MYGLKRTIIDSQPCCPILAVRLAFFSRYQQRTQQPACAGADEAYYIQLRQRHSKNGDEEQANHAHATCHHNRCREEAPQTQQAPKLLELLLLTPPKTLSHGAPSTQGAAREDVLEQQRAADRVGSSSKSKRLRALLWREQWSTSTTTTGLDTPYKLQL